MSIMKLVWFLVSTLVLGGTEAFQSSLFSSTTSTSASLTCLQATISPRDIKQSSSSSPRVPPVEELKIKRGETVLEPYYGIPNGILLAVPAILALHTVYFSAAGAHAPSPLGWAGAAIHLILGYYVLKQTDRVRCVFDRRSFEFKNIKGNELVTKPNKNYVKGTINKWDCAATVDFGYFPSKSYPLVVWFKETETPSGTWGEYGLWGKWLQNPSPTAPSIHFFPGFVDIDAWETEMLARGAQQQSTPQRK